MTTKYQASLAVLDQKDNIQLLTQLQHGIEKESLRIDMAGRLSEQPHPDQLGSKLTHPYITTDYSEALLEFITPVYQNPADALHFQHQLHQYTYQHLDAELLWVNSMPCLLGSDEQIPIAYYGDSNLGKMKYVYREGLAHRYGKAMQTIAGIHYNFSLPSELWELLKDKEMPGLALDDYQSTKYFAMIRNFRRYAWLLMYLFGASPAVSKNFLREGKHDLQSLSHETLYLPYATSLRMSDLGYQNNAQASLNICYNTLPSYVDTISKAIKTPYPKYEQIGVDVNGHYRQLNSNLLQIENEYYSPVRPKRITQSGEHPIDALADKGVEYVEIRCMDLNPFTPLGIDLTTSHFLDTFLTYCALTDSPDIDVQECKAIQHNFDQTVVEGRKPGLTLIKQDKPIQLTDWAKQLLTELKPVAELLDNAWESDSHSVAIEEQLAKVEDSSLTPSAKVIAELQQSQSSFNEFGISVAKQHADYFLATSLCNKRQNYFNALAQQSWTDQRHLEAKDTQSFPEFLADYFRTPSTKTASCK
ncbi:glutamate--cysteine ligase [Spartinivicinus poritis]|uniref:Glutamate--cysteine ligase n=1 Tax=Spartinivicinus poritis TaxID=2994640 RepID=A0ABT5UJM3_9GAMM|nr:glutamate--cysteine ligase [Spartinivicinus sp. A2-2]MDE1465239.1 glutamate--cysteine ligase [Spartinivicinus sp. A2-2]